LKANFNGTIDEVKIYNISLSADQIYQLYLEGNNSYTNSTIVSDETSAGENWTCSVTPNDATEDGTTRNSSTMGIEEAANNPPTIDWVETIDPIGPVDDATRSITFNFTATDQEGASDINISTAQARFQLDGEVTRSNLSCVNWSQSGDDVNFTCNISMWYFDKADTGWIINVTIKDNAGEGGENSSTNFSYTKFTGMKISPTSLEWPEVNLTDTNTSSNNDPLVINNTGNDEPLSINITALDLQGEQYTSYYIYAANFTVENASDGCSGAATAMSNDTSINVTSAILYRGNHSLNYNNATSGQEQLFFCLKEIPSENPAQSYSSAFGAWEIRILLVAVIPATRRRKKKLKKSNKILKLLIELTDELRREYSKEKETIINQLIKAVKEEYKVSRRDVLSLIRKEMEIPINAFSKELGALESIVKYMKENLNMKYNEIAKELGRDERTIWTSYKKASEKMKKPLEIKKTELMLPISIFENKNLTVLESIIIYLKEKGFKFSEIAKLLERDQRNIWTIYSRAIKKLPYKDKNI
jgi:DNA-directed RNA polymerase specialized sigma24 family protein